MRNKYVWLACLNCFAVLAKIARFSNFLCICDGPFRSFSKLLVSSFARKEPANVPSLHFIYCLGQRCVIARVDTPCRTKFALGFPLPQLFNEVLRYVTVRTGPIYRITAISICMQNIPITKKIFRIREEMTGIRWFIDILLKLEEICHNP